MRCRALLLIAGIVAGCGCGPARTAGDGPQGWDRYNGQVDGGIWPDASCSSPPGCGGPAAPTHRALMVYDEYLDYDPAFGRNPAMHVFLDDQGLAIFGAARFLRASLDGALLSAGTERYGTPQAAAQGPDNYAVLFSTIADPSWPRLCMVAKDGTTDVGTCSVMGGYITWDGAAYRVFGRRPGDDVATMSVTTVDATGAELGVFTMPYSALRAPPEFLGEKVVWLSQYKPEVRACEHPWLTTAPRSLDLTVAERWDLLAADFYLYGDVFMASSGRRVALLSSDRCCKQQPWWDEQVAGPWPCGSCTYPPS